MHLRRWLTTSCLRPTIQQILRSPGGTPVEVHGWIRSVRKQKRVAFAAVGDGSCPDGLQAVLSPDLARELTNGTSVRLKGTLVQSKGAGQDKELQVEAVDVLGESDPAKNPIQKQALTTEYLREHAHLRPRVAAQQAVLRLRHRATSRLHSFFQDNSFVHTHTPILTSNDCEGAGETFTLSSFTSPVPDSTTTTTTTTGPPTASEHFFGTPAHLTVSAQLHLEALATALNRVYTLSPCFRAERSQTGRHLSEFWMLEAEWCFTRDVEEVCAFVESMLRAVIRDSLSTEAREPALLIQSDSGKERRVQLEQAAEGAPWRRMTYNEAIDLLVEQHAHTPFEFEPSWGASLASEHERWLAEHVAQGPVFVTHYPRRIKPFYMRANDGDGDGASVDRQTVACFDLLVPGVGELAGGSIREERLEALERAIEEHGMDKEVYKWYVDLRRYGSVPHGGFGLGLERLVGWLAGVENVRECIPMPRWAGRMLL